MIRLLRLLLGRLLSRPARPRPFEEEPGDEILYPTDSFTEDMQPRR